MSDEMEQVEQDFLVSWDKTERAFQWMNKKHTRDWITSIQNLIIKLRVKGYDKQLRAGQSLFNFIMSRSRHKGLKKGFSSIWIDAINDGSMKVTTRFDDTSSEYHFKTIELHDELLEMLDELASRPIDTWQPNK